MIVYTSGPKAQSSHSHLEHLRSARRLTSSAVRARLLGRTIRNDRRSRNNIVIKRTVNVDKNTGVAAGVSAGELYSIGRSAAAALNGDLVASKVELSAPFTTSSVQRNGLSPEEVVTGGCVLGDGNVHQATAVVHVLVAPEVITARPAARVLTPTVLINLVKTSAPVSRGSIVDLGEVDHDGAVVSSANGFVGAGAVVGLLVHLDGDDVSGGDGAGRLGCGGGSITADIVGGDVLDGRVGHRETGAGCALVLAVDPELLEGGMAVGLLGRECRQEGELRGLHGFEVSECETVKALRMFLARTSRLQQMGSLQPSYKLRRGHSAGMPYETILQSPHPSKPRTNKRVPYQHYHLHCQREADEPSN